MEWLGPRTRAQDCLAELGSAVARTPATQSYEPALPKRLSRCHAAAVGRILRWQNKLPKDKRWLLVGVKVGWESAIGMGSHYYPNGNALLDKNPDDDPHWKSKPSVLPSCGFQPIGFAAVTTAGLAKDGDLKEEHLAEVVRRHLDDLSATVERAGFPREQIFTHCGGRLEDEQLYRSALNEHSCPG